MPTGPTYLSVPYSLFLTMMHLFFICRENYLFECWCTKCVSQADDPDMTSEEEMESDCESDCEVEEESFS